MSTLGATVAFDLVRRLKSYGTKRSLFYAYCQVKLAANRAFRKSYSLQGEDLVMDELLGFKDIGFYIDIGASHPRTGNNTRRFYGRGWRGINVEPDGTTFAKLSRDRKRDVNLNIGVGRARAKKPFYSFDASNLSTFSAEAARRAMENGFTLKGESVVEIRTLADILEEHHPSGDIDIMSLDTEGWELEVLEGNDWTRFKPEIICIETGSKHAGDDATREGLDDYLGRRGYIKVFGNELNSIFALSARRGGEPTEGATNEYTRHTASRPYLKLERMASYHYQMELVLDALESSGGTSLDILEIGGSNGVLKANLCNYFEANSLDHRVTSLDIDPSSSPDVVGDVRMMPFDEQSFDVAVCCEVLEHMPYEDAEAALDELHRVARGFVLLTVPHTSLYLSLVARTSRKPMRTIILNILEPWFMKFKRGPLEWSHHWELGYRGYSQARFAESVRARGFSIIQEFRNPLFPTHHFFLLRCETS